MKYDGYRALATIARGRVQIVSRNGNDWTARFVEIAEALARLRVRSAMLDGEVAYVGEDGRTDFQKLQNALGQRADRSRLVYFVFDLLSCNGADLTGEPLVRRKERLRTLLARAPLPLKLGDHVVGDGAEIFARACELGLEGIIAKRGDAPYRPGRGKDWLKLKCSKRQELVIVGFTREKGTRVGLGALLVAVRDGSRYRFAGKVGTGFSRASLEELQAKLRPLVVAWPTVEGAPRMKDVTWVEPRLVAQVRFSDWTQDGVLRHPSFEGLREDKPATGVSRERALRFRGASECTRRARRPP